MMMDHNEQDHLHKASGGALSASSGRNAVIAVFRRHEQANAAIRLLLQHGLNQRSFSLVARDLLAGDRVMVNDHADGAITPWGKLGVCGTNLWGPGLWGLVPGWASVWVPGLGPVLIGGPLISSILGAHDGAAVFGALSPIGAGLYRTGVPKGSVRRYEEAVRKGRYLLVIQGRPDEAIQAGRLLSGTGAEIVALHAHVASAGAPSAPSSGPAAQPVAAGPGDRPFLPAEPNAGR